MVAQKLFECLGLAPVIHKLIKLGDYIYRRLALMLVFIVANVAYHAYLYA